MRLSRNENRNIFDSKVHFRRKVDKRAGLAAALASSVITSSPANTDRVNWLRTNLLGELQNSESTFDKLEASKWEVSKLCLPPALATTPQKL